MTTSTATPRLQYTANGSTTNFTFNFSIADIYSLDVYVGTTLKTYTTDYTITFDSGSAGTGTVVFNSAPAASAAVYLIRNTYNVRSTDFEQGGAFLASTINNELDRLTQGIQDIDNILTDKVFRLAEPTTETATLIIPAAATRANKVLSFDASGNAQTTAVGSGTVTSVGVTSSQLTITNSPITTSGSIGINIPAAITTNVTGNLTGNADTATYASAVTLTADNSTNATNYPLFASAATGNLSPRTDTGLTYNPSTGVLTTTSVTGNLTGNVTGNADTATYSSAVTLTADNSTNATNYPLFASAATGNLSPRTDTSLTYNPSTNTLTAGTFSGNLTGDVTGTVSGNAGSATYASAVTLTADNSTNATNYPLFASAATGNLSPRTDTGFTYNPSSGTLTSTAFAGNLTGAVTGNADTATYASAVTLTADNSTNATNYPLFVNAATGNLSPRTDTGFTYNPSTGVLTTTAVTANLTGNVTGNADTATYSSAVTLTADNSTNAANYILFANAATGNLSPRTDTALSYNPSSDTLTVGTISATAGTSTVNNLTVEGNLVVEGTTTTINTATLDVEDNIITLNSNTSGSATADAGIEVERGTDTNVSLIWNESTDKWTIGAQTFVAGTVEANVTGNLTGDVNTGGLSIADNNIVATQSNDNINLITNGTGHINVDSARVINVLDPVASQDAATKNYIDTQGFLTDIALDTTPQLGSNLDVNGYKIVSVSNGNVELAPNGTGDVYLTADTVRVGDSNAAATLTTNGTGDITINTNAGTNSGSITILNGANGNISITPNGTGSIVLDGLNWPQADGSADYVLKTNGSGQLSWAAQTVDTNTTYSISAETATGGANLRLTDSAAATDDVKIASGTGITVSRTDANTITVASTITDTNTTYSVSSADVIGGAALRLTDSGAGTDDVSFLGGTGITVSQASDQITIAVSGSYLTDIVNDTTPQLGGSLDVNGQTITSVSNGNIELAPNGTGDVYLTADTVRVGDSNANATITTNGTGDLILNTNSGTNSGSITIADAANGDITIKVDGTGKVIMGDDFTAANLDNYTNASNSFPGFSDAAAIKSNLMFTSNLSVPNITQFSERHFNNTIYSYGKADSSGTTYNDTDFRWGNSALSLFDMNGATANSTVTDSRSAAIRGMAISTGYKNSGGGTKTTPNQVGITTFNEIQAGHGGDLTVVNQMGARVGNSVQANTGEFSRITNAIGVIADTISTGGTGANGTNRFVTNEYAFYDAPTTSSSLVTNHYGYYVHTGSAATNKYAFYSADDTYLSRLGTIERYLEKQNSLTSSSTITVDCDLAPIHKVTLGVNTGFVITNLSSGQTVTIIIVQDGTGSRTATFGTDTSTAVKFAGGTPTLSTAANSIDVVTIYNDGTNFLGNIAKAFA